LRGGGAGGGGQTAHAVARGCRGAHAPPRFLLLRLTSVNTPKNAINKNRETISFECFVDFVQKLFDTIFFVKRFL
jgi:hypothetical protein